MITTTSAPLTSSSPVLVHNRMRITDGQGSEFEAAVRRAVDFACENGPQLAIQVFVDEERMTAHSFQLHPDASALSLHRELSGEYIADVMRHCSVERVDLYGLAGGADGGTRSGGGPPVVEWTHAVPIAGFSRSGAGLRQDETSASTAGPGPDQPLGRVSVLGTGAIGAAVARTLVAAGARVTVWNRDQARAEPLQQAGATVADSAAQAAAASDLVLLCLTDYAAVEAVLGAAGSELNGRTVVVMTTGSPDDARQAARSAESAGAASLDAGVQASPEAVGTEGATFLYSGSEEAFARHEPALRVLGAARFVGTDPAAAAVHDLAMFGLWYDAQLAVLRALETVTSVGMSPVDFAPLAAAQLRHVVDGAPQTAYELTTGEFPRGPADLAEHEPVMRKIAELRRGLRMGTGEIDRAADLVSARAAEGHFRHGLNSILAT